MKAKKTSAKRGGAKRHQPRQVAKRPARKVVIEKTAEPPANEESVTLLGDVARIYLEHLA